MKLVRIIPMRCLRSDVYHRSCGHLSLKMLQRGLQPYPIQTQMCPGLATRRFREKHSIVLYLRYADNLLFFLRDDSGVDALRAELLSCLSPYSAKLEEASDYGVKFLDMTVYKGKYFASTDMLLALVSYLICLT
jgi:hypothetical protein